MSWTEELTSELVTRVRDKSLPRPAYAVFGAYDVARGRVEDTIGAIPRAPQQAFDRVLQWYDDLVTHGQNRALEVGTERAVRARINKVEDRITPKATKAAVRITERHRRLKESPKAQAASRARAAARRSSRRLAELNAPVLIDDTGQA